MKQPSSRLSNTCVFVAALCLLGVANQLLANIQVSFREGAPKDRFTISNIGSCDTTDLVLELNLSDSKGKLVFDTQRGGKGVEVFQPFEAGQDNKSEISLLNENEVGDGEISLSLRINRLAPNQSVSFTIDVDDTLPNSQLGMIRVTNSEISGSTVILEGNGSNVSSRFDDSGKAILAFDVCSN